MTSTVPLPGDSNHDNLFNSTDLVQVFIAGEYEDAIPGNSTFEEGDWDGDFTSADFVFALAAGTYTDAVAATSANRVAEIAAAMLGRLPAQRQQPRQLDAQRVDSLFANQPDPQPTNLNRNRNLNRQQGLEFDYD